MDHDHHAHHHHNHQSVETTMAPIISTEASHDHHNMHDHGSMSADGSSAQHALHHMMSMAVNSIKIV
jgi:hypothetical protein